MRRFEFPFEGKRYVYDNDTRILHDLVNETPECKIDEMDTETIDVYSSLNEMSLILDHPVAERCPHCMKKEK